MARGLRHVGLTPPSPQPGIHGPGCVGRRGAGECGAPGRVLPPLPLPPPKSASEPAASGSAAILPPPSLPTAAPPPRRDHAGTRAAAGPQRPRAARRETRLGARVPAALGRGVREPTAPCLSLLCHGP